MKHRTAHRTFGRVRSERRALMRGLAASLIKEEQIITTTAKAKELRPYMDRLITIAKKNTVAGRRLASTRLGEPSVKIIQKLFGPLRERFETRNGGYTRVIKIPRTAGRDQAVIEFLPR